MVATVGKDIALAVASGNPMILVKSIGTKALSQVNMDLKQKLKEIITGKVLGG